MALLEGAKPPPKERKKELHGYCFMQDDVIFRQKCFPYSWHAIGEE